MLTIKDYSQGAKALESKLNGFVPDVLIILGSGLGGLGEYVEQPICIDYKEIPHMCVSTAMGHAGRFIAGRLGGKNALLMQGRLHIYEGWTAEQVAYPVRLSKLLGTDKLIITNAAGGINEDYNVGDLMLIKDFIKFNYPNPLIGPNIDEFGPRFPDMSRVFDREYMELFRSVAKANGDEVRAGVYFYCTGPQYETPAEIRAMRLLGADAVGMSTVPECIAARHAGMRILGISLITNMASGILDRPLCGEEVIAAGNAANARFVSHIIEFLRRMD